MGERRGSKVGVDLRELGVAVESGEGEEGERGGGDRDVGRGGVVDQVEQVARWGDRLALGWSLKSTQVVLFVALVVQRDDGVLLGESPPPLEALSHAHCEVCLALLGLEHRYELSDVPQGARGPPIVRHAGDLAAELEHGHLLVLGEPDLFEDEHPLRLAEDVVVERSLGDAILGAGLCEPQLLCDHRLDRLLQLGLTPRRHFGALCFQIFCFLACLLHISCLVLVQLSLDHLGGGGGGVEHDGVREGGGEEMVGKGGQDSSSYFWLRVVGGTGRHQAGVIETTSLAGRRLQLALHAQILGNRLIVFCEIGSLVHLLLHILHIFLLHLLFDKLLQAVELKGTGDGKKGSKSALVEADLPSVNVLNNVLKL